MNHRYLGEVKVGFLAGERDPSGLAQHQAGAKLDAGKNRLGLVIGGFSLALQEVGRVGTFGAEKYTPNGWKQVANGVERYTDAMYRHLLEEATGERLDSQTGIAHAAHAAWNALARLDLMLRDVEGRDLDDMCRAGKGEKPASRTPLAFPAGLDPFDAIFAPAQDKEK